MEIRTKHRILGIVVLAALAIIVIPIFFGHSNNSADKMSSQASNPPAKPTELAIPALPTNTKPASAAPSSDLATQPLQSAIGSTEQDASPPAETASPSTSSANPTSDQQSSPDQQQPAATESPVTTEPSSTAEPSSISTQQVPKLESSKPVPRVKTGAVKKELAAVNKTHTLKKAKMAIVKPAEAAQAWTVQLASFTQKTNAQELVKKLRNKGFVAYMHEAKAENGYVSRVFVGPELYREKADDLAKKLQELFRLKGVVVEYKV